MNSIKKNIVITGASTGIGRACTEYLAFKGYSIYAGARKDKDLKELGAIKNVTPIKLDVTNQSDVDAMVALFKKENVMIDGLINNAGIAVVGPLMDIPAEDFINQLDVNVIGVHRVTKALFPFLLASKGRIIMISSNSGFMSAPFFGPYCASKFAIEAYSDALRRELLLHDVKVVIIQPGRIKTPIWDKGENEIDKFKGSMFEKLGRKIAEYAVRKGRTDSLDPKKVAELVHKALTIDNPKTRYMIVPDKFRNKMLKILPDKKIDKVIEKEFKKLLSE